MGKIASIEYFRVPPRWLFVKITDDTGAFGWGEASLEGHTNAVEGCLDAWSERYTGLDADDIENIWQLSWRARKLNVPIYQLLGGKVRNKIRVYAWIGGDRPNAVEAQAQARKDQGFLAVKMNGTADTAWLDSPSVLKEVIARVKAVKELGLDAAVDFHGRVHKPMAKRLAKALEPYEPLFIEEPLLSENITGIKQLSELTTVPIALGERLYSRWDVRPFLENGSVDILQPDICHVGGISEMRRIGAAAETYDVGLAPHCPLGPIALAANIQVDTTLPNFAIQEMGIGMHYNNGGQDITSYIANPEVWDVREGHIDILTGPGLGIEINEEEVRRLSKDAKSWPVPEFRGPCGGASRVVRYWATSACHRGIL
ncbi:Mandelate racemase/muconate lactonizing enzyme, C-terminal [Fusarium oxysporum f. sp. vasinfectum]|nr:Mandelate racemase/muconate lactonizing enzyme, C-terminal [Fusarium oxysporum f. sp. vasinfectum]